MIIVGEFVATFGTVLGSGFTLMACVIFYVSSPNQQWLSRRPISFKPACALSATLLVAGYLVMLESMSALSVTFFIATVVMASLGILPLLTRYQAPQSTTAEKTGLLSKEKLEDQNPQWLSKIGITLTLGFLSALAASTLIFAFLTPGPVTHDFKSQLVMWMVIPLWLIPLSLMFFTQRATRLLLGYSLVNIALWSALVWIR